jgi:hypothetical protein
MSNWLSSIDAGTGAITPTGSAISLLSVSQLTMAPTVCVYAQTCADIGPDGDRTRSVVVTAQDDVSDDTGAIAERWVQPDL